MNVDADAKTLRSAIVVNLAFNTPLNLCWCLPHTRGGVLCLHAITGLLTGSSHTRGVFSACRSAPRSRASRLPHTRGVFPSSAPCSSGDHRLPHAWGVSPVVVVLGTSRVFPARVGVFLSCRVYNLTGLSSSPHAWGVSCMVRDSTVAPCLPYHATGCFYLPASAPWRSCLPTRVGCSPSWPSS